MNLPPTLNANLIAPLLKKKVSTVQRDVSRRPNRPEMLPAVMRLPPFMKRSEKSKPIWITWAALDWMRVRSGSGAAYLCAKKLPPTLDAKELAALFWISPETLKRDFRESPETLPPRRENCKVWITADVLNWMMDKSNRPVDVDITQVITDVSSGNRRTPPIQSLAAMLEAANKSGNQK